MNILGIISAIIAAAKEFFGYAKEKEKNLPIRELDKLDEDAAKLRVQIDAAFDDGNTLLMSELQNRLDANYRRAKTLRDARSNEGQKRD